MKPRIPPGFNPPLKRGDLVYALRDLVEGEAVTYKFQYGVVFEEANAYGDGLGPMVMFPGSGIRRNVYRGDVIEAKAYVQWQAAETRRNEKRYAREHLAQLRAMLKQAIARVQHAKKL